MNRTMKILTAGLAVAALSAGGAAIATADPGTLENGESTSLAFTREEEKMAHDLYTAFADKYDNVVWDHIAASEERHYEAVGRLLEHYDLADPAAGNAAGAFDDADLQQLYADWLAQGSASEDAAFQAAIELEERDITDLTEQLKAVDNEDIEQVYQALLRSSERHLAAFTAAADGETLVGEPPAWAGRRGADGTMPGGAMCDGTGQFAGDGTGMGGRGMRGGWGGDNASWRGMNRGDA